MITNKMAERKTSMPGPSFGITREDIFFMVKGHLRERHKGSEAIMYSVLEDAFNRKFNRQCSITNQHKQKFRTLLFELRRRWQRASRTEERFLKDNQEWLKVFFELAEGVTTNEAANTPTGRRTGNFLALSERTKRRRTEQLRSDSNTEELAYATQMSLRAEGKVDAAAVVRDVTMSSPTRAQKYRHRNKKASAKVMSGEAALALMIELRLSRQLYQSLRDSSVEHGCKLYPSYKQIQLAKRACYPSPSFIKITDISAELNLQALLDHTTKRILLLQTEVFSNSSEDKVLNLQMICKWGCDGSSGQSNYKQRMTNAEGNQADDSSIFLTSLVPLQLRSSDQNIIVWQNPRPSSPRYCRPIKIEFVKETTEQTLKQIKEQKLQVQALIPFQCGVDGKRVRVTYTLALTMIDGKVCNAITQTSSTQRCHLCKATSKEFNDIDDLLARPVNPEHLQFGLSNLHAWIRVFECCLHVAYRLDVHTWQIRDSDMKKIVEERKKYIQDRFRSTLGLIVDKPKQVHGNTNDGNTARRFFENIAVAASITGLNAELLKRFHVNLQVISCGHRIDVDMFEEYALETARIFVQLYPWYYMPTVVHKILLHGKEIIAHSLLPIGQMSEEAQESCNKYFKRFREDFSRKCSRAKTMEDVFLRLLIMSDPIITSQRQLPRKQLRCMDSEAIDLLESPMIKSNESRDSDSDSFAGSGEDSLIGEYE